jgi:SAM-dependent methyltransferase
VHHSTSYDLNRANWDERAPLHLASREYAVQSFVDDPDRLSDVVTFDRDRLGDLRGLRAVHLQCHIGTDTISLERLGAEVTGLDFSSAAIEGARDLAARANSTAVFVEASVDDAVSALGEERFDLVYTGIGALCWLPDIAAWARTVSSLLAPGGRLFIREGHPVLWAIDEEQTGGLVLGYPYFEQSEPLVWDDASTYVETDESITSSVTHEWNHGIGEILTAVLEAGLTITGFVEHTSIPWEALPGRMRLDDDGEWMLSAHAERLPLSYTLQAVKTS